MVNSEGSNRVEFGEGITLADFTLDRYDDSNGPELVLVNLPAGGSLLMTSAEFATFVAFDFADGTSGYPSTLPENGAAAVAAAAVRSNGTEDGLMPADEPQPLGSSGPCHRPRGRWV